MLIRCIDLVVKLWLVMFIIMENWMMIGEYLGLVFMICKDGIKNFFYMYNINIWNIVCFNVIVIEIVKNNKN